MRRALRLVGGGLVTILLAACVPQATPTASAPLEPSATPRPEPTASVAASLTIEPTPTPEPSLSIDLPDTEDSRTVTVEVQPEVGADGGEILVTVMSNAEGRIDEVVLRWPTELGETLFLSPFVPSEDRIREGGPPLVQQWTKWVVGPGERGEPEGTISLGYGPLLPGATLAIPIAVERRADGPVAFDLQVLSSNDILSLPDGQPAELRVEIP